MWQISRLIGMAFLVGLSIEDMRFRRVSECLLIIAGILGIGYQLCRKEVSVGLVLGGVGIGVGFLVLSYVTRESLGYGDSLLICILGIYVGAAELIEMLLIAWIMAGIAAIILMAYKHFSRKTTLPFVPFLTMGYALVSIGTYMGNFTGGT